MLVEWLRGRRWRRETLAAQRATAWAHVAEVAGQRLLTPLVPHPERDMIGAWTSGATVEQVPADAPATDLAGALEAVLAASLAGTVGPEAGWNEALRGLGVRSDRGLQQRGLMVSVRRLPTGEVEVEPEYPCGGGWQSEPEQMLTLAPVSSSTEVAEAVVAMHDDMATRRPRARAGRS